MAMEQEQNPQEGTKNVWKTAMGVLCLGILTYGWRYSQVQDTGETLPSIVGYCLPSAFLIWIAVRIVILRGCGVRVAGVCFLAIYGASIAGALLGVAQQKAEAKQAVGAMHNQWVELMEASTDSYGIPRPIQGRLDTERKARGKFGEVEGWWRDYMAQAISQRNDYLRELDRIGWARILDPERIARDTTLVESRMMIQRAKEIVEKYERMTGTLLANTRQRMQGLATSTSLRQELTSGFDRGMEEAQIERLWALEKEVLSESESIFDLLSRRPRQWVISDGRILFYDKNDLRRFHSCIISIQDFASEQQEIQHRNALAVSRSFDSMKQVLK